MKRLTRRKENGEAYVLLYADPEYPADVVREQLKKEVEVINKLADYEDLEEQLEQIYSERMTLKKVVENLNRIVQNDEEKLDYARILTNVEAEKWDRWLTLEKQDRLRELPCKMADKVTITNEETGEVIDITEQREAVAKSIAADDFDVEE